jgi:hypothetical protein
LAVLFLRRDLHPTVRRRVLDGIGYQIMKGSRYVLFVKLTIPSLADPRLLTTPPVRFGTA